MTYEILYYEEYSKQTDNAITIEVAPYIASYGGTL